MVAVVPVPVWVCDDQLPQVAVVVFEQVRSVARVHAWYWMS